MGDQVCQMHSTAAYAMNWAIQCEHPFGMTALEQRLHFAPISSVFLHTHPKV
jgi:hypothetical protein